MRSNKSITLTVTENLCKRRLIGEDDESKLVDPRIGNEEKVFVSGKIEA
jgi:hypothetical protein